MDQPIEDGLEERAPVAFDSSDSDYEAEEPSYGAAEEGKLPTRRLRPFAWSWRKFAAFAGPGWLMSLAYLDPGNLESDLQLGAYTRYSLLWVLFWATAGGLLLQEMAARLGVVTGETLAKCVKRAYGPRVSLLLYGAAELAIVGSDVQEVLGTATGLRILFGLPLWAGCVVTAIDTCTFFLVQRLGWRALEAAIGALVVTLAVAFIGVWAAAPSEPGPLLYGLAVPTMRPSMLTPAYKWIAPTVKWSEAEAGNSVLLP